MTNQTSARPSGQDAEPIDAEAEMLGETCSLNGHEEPDAGDAGGGLSLEERLAEAEQQAEEQRQSCLRALAELENVRKRSAREMDKLRKFAVEEFARDLLPVADNMERAMAHISAQTGDAEGAAALQALVDGVAMVQGELMRVLAKHGVTRLAALDQTFDHNLHQAVMQVEAREGVAPLTVVQELQAGYLIHDRLLRPAMVAVTAA